MSRAQIRTHRLPNGGHAFTGVPRLVKILFLENHAVFARLVIRRFLSDHKITVVPSLAEARGILAAADFDFELVLSDYDLDDGKGAEFVRECRALYPSLPIIAVSSHDEGNATLLRAGASAVCGKMEFERIAETIHDLTGCGG